MDFSVFPCMQAKKKPPPKAAPPPAPAPASTPEPPPPPPPAPANRLPRLPGYIPQIMQQLPRVPGSRNVEMTFRWNFADDMDGYGYDQQYYGDYYGHPSRRSMPAGPFRHMAPPLPSSRQYHMPPPLLGGMNDHSHTNCGCCDPYCGPPSGHYGGY